MRLISAASHLKAFANNKEKRVKWQNCGEKQGASIKCQKNGKRQIIARIAVLALIPEKFQKKGKRKKKKKRGKRGIAASFLFRYLLYEVRRCAQGVVG